MNEFEGLNTETIYDGKDIGDAMPAIAEGTVVDLNTIISAGFYHREANVAVTNIPNTIGTSPFALEVISTGGQNRIQRLTRGVGIPTTYKRVYSGGVWGDWYGNAD